MFVDDLKTARKVSLAILLVTIQLVIIAAFGARWTSGGKIVWTVVGFTHVSGVSPPYSTIIPYPNYADWWFGLTAIVMYIVLVFCFLYIMWTVAQIALPDKIPFDLKMIVLVDVVFAALLTLMLLFAYCFFAGGFGGKNIPYLGYGYCFWLAVTCSISSFSVVLISGISWYRNN